MDGISSILLTNRAMGALLVGLLLMLGSLFIGCAGLKRDWFGEEATARVLTVKRQGSAGHLIMRYEFRTEGERHTVRVRVPDDWPYKAGDEMKVRYLARNPYSTAQPVDLGGGMTWLFGLIGLGLFAIGLVMLKSEEEGKLA